MRPAERLLDGRRCLGAGEDEAEILPTFGERNHVLARMHRDRDVLHAVDLATKDDTLKHKLATAALDNSAGAGPFLLLAGGLCVLVGALVP